MADEEGSLCLLDVLPEVLLLHCLSFCEAQTLLRFSLACRRARLLSREPALWRGLLSSDYRLSTPAPDSPDSDTHQLTYRGVCETLRGRGYEPLPFRGVYTDGGVDDGGADAGRSHQVTNLFSPARHAVFCSSLPSNVHAVACLEADDGGAAARNLTRRERLIARLEAPAAVIFRGHPEPRRKENPDDAGITQVFQLPLWSDNELASLFLQLWNLAEQNAPLAMLLLADLTPEERIAEMPLLRELAAELLAERSAPAAPADEWLPLPSPSSAVAVVNRVRVSRVGQFSCPLACGAVFLATPSTPLADVPAGRAWLAAHAEALSSEGLPSERAPLRLLDGCLTVEDVHSLKGRPAIVSTGESLAGRWIVFERRPAHSPADAPWPLAWFAFRTRESAAQLVAAGRELLASEQPYDPAEWATELAAARAWEDDEDVFDVLDWICLPTHSGSLLTVTLIAPEDLMAAWGDEHAILNIDATSVTVSGALADFPA